MPALALLLAALGLNYSRHRRGLSTICSTSRRVVGPRMFLAGWFGLTAYMVPHYCKAFRRIVAVVEAFDDSRPEIEEIP